MRLSIRTLALGAVLSAAAVTQAGWVQWTSGSGGNDHWYRVELIASSDKSWSQARIEAQSWASGSDLATITSAAENAFVFSLASSLTYWGNDAASNSQGPYLGGFQPAGSSEPSGGWQWVTGEAWSYTNWASGEPNNYGGTENVLQMFGHGLNNPQPTWNDVTDGPGGPQKSYVAEMASAPVPEPFTMALGASAVALALRRRRRA